MIQNAKQSIKLSVYLSIALCVGIFLGANMTHTSSRATSSLIKYIQKLRQVLVYIENDYVDDVDTDDLVEGVIENILAKLDPHSIYIPPKDVEIVQSQLEGNYEGIGIEFNIFKDTIFVVTPLSGGPSEKSGIQIGDKIIKVDGKNVTGSEITNRKVVEILRGKKGSEVVVAILRKEEKKLINFNIKRDVIPQYSVDVSYMVNDEIGYIKVSRFANSTFSEFKKALLTLKKQGMNKMILDLKGNPGGYLQRAVQMVDEILSGEKVIVYTNGRAKKYSEEYFSGKTGDFENGAIVVMIDEGSASASEIVAGAIQDHNRGLIVGRRSFGKGLVQRPISLSDGSQLRLTISRYYTPSGRSIQKSYDKPLKDYHADSIKIVDSLPYQTSKRKKVQDKGGIIPDYSIPSDTSQNTMYLSRLFSTNSIQEFTIKYAEKHRRKLQDMGYERFKNSFEVNDKLLKELIHSAKINGLKFNKIEFEKSKKLIRLLIKAYIARGIWNNKGFYPIFNEQDEIYKKAISVVSEAEKMIR